MIFVGQEPWSALSRPLVHYPNEILSTPVTLVPPISDWYEISNELIFALQKLGGVGLAANQLGMNYRCFAIKMLDDITVFFDPKIKSLKGPQKIETEGCLSIPNVQVSVSRYTIVNATAYKVDGEKVTLGLNGLQARIFQHEFDHLEGKTILDYQSPKI